MTPSPIRKTAESMLRAHWSDPSPILGLALAPPSILYRAGVAVRNTAYDRGWLPSTHPGIPVVSVGNVVVGGSGKTPVSAWVAEILDAAGRAPAVVSRGYGLDEVELHRTWHPEIPVYVEPDRIKGAASARSDGRGCVVLDDGFQHRRIARDLDIVLHPVEVPMTAHVLPNGPLREPLKSLSRADFLVFTSKSARSVHGARMSQMRDEFSSRFPGLPLAEIHFVPDGWTDLQGSTAEAPESPALAATGIARPEGFLTTLDEVLDVEIELVAFPDHHEFTPAELDRLVARAGDRPILLTEKDAARIRASGRELSHPVRVLRLSVKEGEGCDSLRRRLLARFGGEQFGDSTFSVEGDSDRMERGRREDR